MRLYMSPALPVGTKYIVARLVPLAFDGPFNSSKVKPLAAPCLYLSIYG